MLKSVSMVLAGLVLGATVGGPVIAGAAGGLGSGKFAQSPLGKLVAGNLGRWLTLRSEVNLSDQQRDQLRSVVMTHKAELAGAAKKIGETRTALREAVLADGADQVAIRKAADDMGKAIGDMAVVASKVAAQAKPLLTEEQRKKIKETQAQCAASVSRFLAEAAVAQ